MSLLIDETRPFWLPALNEVAGRPTGGLHEWLRSGDFAVHHQVAQGGFRLHVPTPRPLVTAFAADLSRLSSASLESSLEMERAAHSPKAAAWCLIRLYYAGFFAVHSILRAYGVSVSQLEYEQTKHVEDVADAWQMLGTQSIPGGTYICAYSDTGKELSCSQARGGTGGAHEVVWEAFLKNARTLGSHILSHGSTTRQRQTVVAKLEELDENLCLQGRNAGNWLSYMRNQITYRQAYGCWYPYKDGESRIGLLRVLDANISDPMNVPLASLRQKPLQCFVGTLGFILGWQHSLLADMKARCPRGTSFITVGPFAYSTRMAGRR